MKTFKRIIALLTATIMIISLCACGGGKNPGNVVSNVDDETQHVDLKWYIYGDEPVGFDKVMAKANEYLEEKLNASLELVMVPSADYDSKVQLALAANEAVDIIWTSDWKFKYSSNVSKGAFMAIDDYLELPELSELKNYYPESIWDAVRIGESVYGVPENQVLYIQYGQSFITEVTEKYDLVDDVRNCSSMDELTEIYQKVRDGEPKNFVITAGQGTHHFEPYYADISCGLSIIDGKVDDRSESNFNYAKRMRDWKLRGFFSEGGADMNSLINQKLMYSVYQRYLPGVEGKWIISKKYDAMIIPTSEAVLDRFGVQSTINSISTNCKNPVRALKLLNLLTKDEYLLNLICYGIEGEDFVRDENNPKRMERLTNYYVPEFLVGSQFLAYLVPSYEDGVWEETIAANNAARVDENIGFSFDPNSVESEIAQVSAVKSDYGSILNGGLDDPEIVFPEYQKKMELAGLDTIKDEIQRQYDEWKATQK